MTWQIIQWKPGTVKMRRVPHSVALVSAKIPWLYACRHCGLIPLKNDRTKAALKAGCEVEAE